MISFVIMRIMKRFISQVVFIAIWLLFPYSAIAQDATFNVPPAEVMKKREIFLQHENQFSERFGLFTDIVRVGVGYNTEVNLVLSGIGTNNVANEVLNIGLKTAIPLHKESNTKLTIGHLLPASLRGSGVGGDSFVLVSSQLPKIGTRISSGIRVGTTTLFGRDIVSYIAAVQHPLTKRIDLLLDWHSGRHINGLLIGGFIYKFTPSFSCTVGYQIPNSRGINRNIIDDGFVIKVTKIFDF